MVNARTALDTKELTEHEESVFKTAAVHSNTTMLRVTASDAHHAQELFQEISSVLPPFAMLDKS